MRVRGLSLNLSVRRVHQWAFYLLCGFGLCSNISIAGANIFLGTLVAVLLLRLWIKHDDWQTALPDGRMRVSLLILMGAIILSSLFSSDISKSLRTFGDYYGYRMLGLYAVLLMIREKRQLAIIAVCVAISFAVNDLAVIYQGIFQGNFRASGFSIYMSVGGFLSMLLPSLVLLLLSGQMDEKYRIPARILLLLGCIALLYNGTRGAWLAVPIVTFLCCGLLMKQKKRFVAAAVLVCILFGGIFASVPILSSRLESIGDMNLQSNAERIRLWTSAYHMFEDHPALGVGFAQFKSEYQGGYILPDAKERELTHAHSNVMHMLAECGAVGLLALLFFWGTWILQSVRIWSTTHEIAALIAAAVVMGLILQGLTEYNMGNSAVMKLHWLLLGLCLQWGRLDGIKRIR